MNRITSTITYGNNVNNLDEWQSSSNPWTVTLRYQGRQMTVPFWTGIALGEPTTSDVVSCLAMDSSGYENARSFEEWASEYGYDTDSRKAEKTFKQVEKQTEKFKRLLNSEYESVIYTDEESIKQFCKDAE